MLPAITEKLLPVTVVGLFNAIVPEIGKYAIAPVPVKLEIAPPTIKSPALLIANLVRAVVLFCMYSAVGSVAVEFDEFIPQALPVPLVLFS